MVRKETKETEDKMDQEAQRVTGEEWECLDFLE